MNLFRRDKERERFYLLPGMGGRAYRRKRNIILAWSIAAGMVVSLGVGVMIYYIANM